MSKLGKKPINIPKDTQIKIEEGKLLLKGPKGTKELSINEKVFSATVNENNLIVKMIKNNENSKKMWGTTRSLVNSAIIGVSTGHEKTLILTGVGLRATLKGESLSLQLGFSHDVFYKIPKDVKINVEKSTIIKISGIDKDIVGKVASEIKMLKPVEPYKGKGIKLKDQYVLRKEGKKK